MDALPEGSRYVIHGSSLWGCRAACMVVFLLVLFIGDRCTAQSREGGSPDWTSFDQAVERARADERCVFVQVYAPWCGWCHKMTNEVYSDPRVRMYLNNQFALARLNYDDTQTRFEYRGRQLSARQLAGDLRVRDVPALVVLDPDGRYLLHLTGFIEPTPLLTVLRYFGSGRYMTESFSAFEETQK